MSRIGVFGGTFDPVHKGHVLLAQDAALQADLSRVIFMPAGIQPFKVGMVTAGAEERLAMLKLAVEDHDNMDVSSIEVEADRISYTYMTLRILRGMLCPEDRLFFISGTDTFLKLEKWKNSGALLRENSFIVGTRPGYRENELERCMEIFRGKYGTESIKIDNRELDISATDIRKKLAEGKSIADIVPEKVERYIRENELYK